MNHLIQIRLDISITHTYTPLHYLPRARVNKQGRKGFFGYTMRQVPQEIYQMP